MGRDGGYEDGYRSCDCFWGREPGSLLQILPRFRPSLAGLRVLDAGCGEGKNAIAMARAGAVVEAVDCSEAAIRNALAAWPDADRVCWRVEDVMAVDLGHETFDLVILYGLLHCLSESEIRTLVHRCKLATASNGLHVVVAFNSRSQNLEAHPGFDPTLLNHMDYLHLYSDWRIICENDSDLSETHPHNGIPHTHSLTRLIVERQ